jgi:hypothetical protein
MRFVAAWRKTECKRLPPGHLSATSVRRAFVAEATVELPPPPRRKGIWGAWNFTVVSPGAPQASRGLAERLSLRLDRDQQVAEPWGWWGSEFGSAGSASLGFSRGSGPRARS